MCGGIVGKLTMVIQYQTMIMTGYIGVKEFPKRTWMQIRCLKQNMKQHISDISIVQQQDVVAASLANNSMDLSDTGNVDAEA